MHQSIQRYGYNSAIKITKQCSARSSVNTSNLECAHKVDTSTLRADLAQLNQWYPPLKAESQFVTRGVLRGKGHSSSSQSSAPNICRPSSRTSIQREVNTKQLDRAIQREVDLWRDIALKAKGERFIIRSVPVANKRAMHQKGSKVNRSKSSRMQLNSVKGKQHISSKVILLG